MGAPNVDDETLSFRFYVGAIRDWYHDDAWIRPSGPVDRPVAA
jgi:hypothetical protein